MLNVTDFPNSVHANRDYPENDVRHLKIYPNINSSVSGQFGRKNFSELIKRIKEVFQGKIIYFLDTRHDTHFELNNKSVSFKYDNNIHLSPDQIIEREKSAAAFYLNQSIEFKQNIKHGEPWKEFVSQGEIMRDFIEQNTNENIFIYQRMALDDQGPMSDQQVENFHALLLKAQKEGSWLHINSIVGGSPAKVLAMMEDILKNASNETLQSIATKYGEKYISPDSEVNVEKNAARAVFLKEYYEFAKTKDQHMQSWTQWKSQNISM
ncbi:MAG: hypothetical protein H0U27_05310 [Nitrosopumilus sp.]|nr:hypothetical protein [Nitrosopumilus sp.]